MNKKFTLIELLVVVSIIGILVSILLPSLQSARKKAGEIVCISNIKQCMTLNLIYSKDSDSVIVNRKQGGPLNMESWSWMLYKSKLLELSSNGGIYQCTEVRDETTPGSEQAIKLRTYGINLGNYYKNVGWSQRKWMSHKNVPGGWLRSTRIDMLPSPSEYLFLADTRSQVRSVNFFSFSGSWTKIWTIHRPDKRAVAAFADGHVKSTAVNKIRELTSPILTYASGHKD